LLALTFGSPLKLSLSNQICLGEASDFLSYRCLARASAASAFDDGRRGFAAPAMR